MCVCACCGRRGGDTARGCPPDRTDTRATRQALASGLNAITRIARDGNYTGVHGPLIDLFHCSNEFNTAVEVTAGNSLFNVVVDTDETAAQLVTRMNQERVGGRITFMPLNLIKSKLPEYPQSDDAIPLVSQLQFEPVYQAVMAEIFGKTLVCRNMEVASQYAKSARLDCITLDGDQVHRKGALTGGYLDVRHSRLETMRRRRAAAKLVDELTRELSTIKRNLDETDQRVNQVLGEIQRLESRRTECIEANDEARAELKNAADQEAQLQRQVEQKQKALASLEHDIAASERELALLRSEINTELVNGLSAASQARLQELTDSLQDLQRILAERLSARAAVENSKQQLEIAVRDNLRRRRDELAAELDEIHDPGTCTAVAAALPHRRR